MMKSREIYDYIATVMETINAPEKDEVLAFIEKQKEILDNRNAASRKRSAEKRAAGDALKERIAALVEDAPMTVPQIMGCLEDETLTPAKIVARMTQLVNEGRVTKSTVKTEDGRKLVAYGKVTEE